MILLLEANQIKPCWGMIRTTIDRSFPVVQEELKTELLHDLLLGVAHAWAVTDGEEITGDRVKGMFITRFSSSYSTGGKVITVLAACAFQGVNDEIFSQSVKAIKKFAKANGCEVMDFYTNNDAIVNYMQAFKILWECKYFQIDLREV